MTTTWVHLFNKEDLEQHISIEQAIAQLLYQNDCVIVPQLGGFVKTYRPAAFDYLEGKISPPSSNIVFNENLVVDDGLLIMHYRRANGMGLAEAQRHIEQYSQQTRFVLDNKETVDIPSVGRLLRDYENQSRFISEKHNFNVETYGLPEVRYHPIPRGGTPTAQRDAKVTARTHVPPPVTESTLASGTRRSQRWAKVAIPVFVGLVLLSAALFFWSKRPPGKVLVSDAAAVGGGEAERTPVNVSPSQNNRGDNAGDLATVQTPVTNDSHEGIPQKDAPGEEEFTPKEGTTEAASEVTPTPQKTAYSGAVIYVGVYSRQKGVDATAAKILDLNWTPVVLETRKGLKRVRVLVAEGVNARNMLDSVRKELEPKAFIGK